MRDRLATAIAYGVLMVAVSVVVLHLVQPARADDFPGPIGVCYGEADLADDVKAHGDLEVGAVSVQSDHGDEIILVQEPGSLVAWMFKDGCVVGRSVVDTITPRQGA